MRKSKGSQAESDGWILPPAYPLSGPQLFQDLRGRLAKSQQCAMSFGRLAAMAGLSRSNTHYWFEIYSHPQVRSYFCWLEWLSPADRQACLESHCRILPTFEDARLRHSPAKVGRLRSLLSQPAGLTLVTGGTVLMREFFVTALGHERNRDDSAQDAVRGIILHRPDDFVPVPSVLYADPSLGGKKLRQLILPALPRILTSRANLLIFQGVWFAVPEVHEDLLRCAAHKHVLIAEAGTPDLATLKHRVSTPIHVLTLSAAQHTAQGIRVNCRCINRKKRP